MRLEVFEDQVIDRLFELNARRAGEENDTGLGAGGGKKSRPKKPVRSKAGKRKQKGEEQLSLFGDDEK